MPYKTTWEHDGAFTNWWGLCSSTEVVEFLQKFQANANFDHARYSLHDFSECENFKCDHDEMNFVAALDAAGSLTNFKIKVGVVTDRVDVIHAVNAYKQTKLSPYTVQIFSTVADARKWLSA